MGLRRIAAVLVAAPLIALGCYSPNISDRGYACGDHGECPEHFHCASNHLCYQHDASIDMQAVCNSVTTVQPITSCSSAGASGQCNPICQTGCNNCGWCAVVGGAATCLTGTAGKMDVGATCDPTKSSECSPGLYCQPETCGTVTTGTCYQLCDRTDTTNSVCGAKSACNVTAKKSGDGNLPFELCSPICDPISQSNMNCQSPFACYPSGATTTECDCAGTAGTGDTCLLAEACAPGKTCVGSGGANTCRPVCTATATCASGTTCNIPTGAASGTCM
jgi:hypothetical protein